MTWGNNSVFELLIIQGSQAITGLFLYNGLGAPGNPPQFAAVASGVTTDPFGNAITSSKILIQGNVITESGGIFRTAAASPLIQLDGPHNAVEIYNAASQLIVGAAGTATNDGFGSAIPAGISCFTIVTGTFAGTYAVTLNDQTQPWGTTVAALTFHNFTNAENLSPAVTAQAHSTAGCNLNLQSGKTLAGSVAATVQVQDSVSSGVTGGLVDIIAGKLTAILPDGNQYRTERLIQRTTATQQFTLASAVAITSLSVPLGVGSYHVSLKVFWAPSAIIGSTHIHNFAFTGTATGNVNGQCWQAQAANAVQQTSLNAGAGNNLTANLTSPTHVNFPGWTELEADITVTVAGTLTHTITLTTAGDDITTSAGTFWEVKPL